VKSERGCVTSLASSLSVTCAGRRLAFLSIKSEICEGARDVTRDVVMLRTEVQREQCCSEVVDRNRFTGLQGNTFYLQKRFSHLVKWPYGVQESA
jgi:hypothetical protein